MKFALRDDDLNYYFHPSSIYENYKDIWDICPVSMSAVPFVKGDWPSLVGEFAIRGPGFLDEVYLNEIKNDNKVFKIGDNNNLVEFVRSRISEKKIYVCAHGITHRNEDESIPYFKSNYGFGAEFYTSRDLTHDLYESIQYLQSVFSQKIEIFTFPQELHSHLGLKAVLNNDLSICGALPTTRSLNTLNCLGFLGYLQLLKNRIFREFQIEGKIVNPYPIYNGKVSFLDSIGLNYKYEDLVLLLDKVYERNGVFVISTHSWSFNSESYKNPGLTERDLIIKLINHAVSKGDVQFVNLKDATLNV
jgi:hypothetical protein